MMRSILEHVLNMVWIQTTIHAVGHDRFPPVSNFRRDSSLRVYQVYCFHWLPVTGKYR